MWNIEYRYIEDWLDEQDTETVAHVFAALELLQDQGPNLGRPLVDTIQGAQLGNLKELRPASPGRGEIRILFAFDQRRRAVMLLAGDKAKGKSSRHKWTRWYKRAIPQAIRLFREYVESGGEDDGKPRCLS